MRQHLRSFSNLAASAALSTTAWTKVQGTFSFSNLPGRPPAWSSYIQSSSATDSFYIDDVAISELAPPPPNPSQQDNTGITTNFRRWRGGRLEFARRRPRWPTAPRRRTAATHSLLTTGRIANYDGPQISVSNKMYNGSQYTISVWVMLLPTDGSSHVINMSLQTTLSGNTSYPSVTGLPRRHRVQRTAIGTRSA